MWVFIDEWVLFNCVCSEKWCEEIIVLLLLVLSVYSGEKRIVVRYIEMD